MVPGKPDDELPEALRPPAKPKPRQLFPRDEMSTGQTSRLVKRARSVIGATQKAPQAQPAKDAPQVDVKALARTAELATLNAARAGKGKGAAKPASGDTFVQRKMRQAEINLPQWDDEEEPG